MEDQRGKRDFPPFPLQGLPNDCESRFEIYRRLESSLLKITVTGDRVEWDDIESNVALGVLIRATKQNFVIINEKETFMVGLDFMIEYYDTKLKLPKLKSFYLREDGLRKFVICQNEEVLVFKITHNL